jgi:hypothetical protein
MWIYQGKYIVFKLQFKISSYTDKIYILNSSRENQRTRIMEVGLIKVTIFVKWVRDLLQFCFVTQFFSQHKR